MKTLVVYYSRTGNTKKIGEEIARHLEAEEEEIIPLKDRKGMLGYLLSGYESSKKKLPQIQKTEEDPEKYDLVAIGTPVWAWTVASPVRAYLECKKGSFNNVAFFCTEGGSGDKKAFDEMEKIIGKKPIAVLTVKASEISSKQYMERLGEFAKKLKSN